VDTDITAFEHCVINPTERQRVCHIDPESISSDDSVTPPPTVSPPPRQMHTFTTVHTYPNTTPISYVVRVYGRQSADFRSENIFIGTFTTPYVEGSMQSRLHLNRLIAQTELKILQTRPFNLLRNSVQISISSPEISYTNKDGHHVSIYPRDFRHAVHNYWIPNPWSTNDTALITVSVLISMRVRPHLRPRHRPPLPQEFLLVHVDEEPPHKRRRPFNDDEDQPPPPYSST
jgi:hypothetical protein